MLVAGQYRPVHGQHRPRAQREGGDARRLPERAHLDHLAALHRHVRLVHRLQLRLRPGAAGPVRRVLPRRREGGPGQDRLSDVPGAAAGFPGPPGRRLARRPVRRGADHVLELRGHGSRRGGRVRRVRAAVTRAVLRRVHRAVRPVRPGQRVGVHDDPGDLPALGHSAPPRPAPTRRPPGTNPAGCPARSSASPGRSGPAAASWSMSRSGSRSSSRAPATPHTSPSSRST